MKVYIVTVSEVYPPIVTYFNVRKVKKSEKVKKCCFVVSL